MLASRLRRLQGQEHKRAGHHSLVTDNVTIAAI
jgi:hypothetical protein